MKSIMPALALLLLVTCCGLNEKVVVNTKVVSPDKEFEAVSTTHLGGGAAGYVSDIIYLIKKGDNFATKDIVFESSHTKGLDIHWLENNLLVISYKDADIRGFCNKMFFDEKNGIYKVEVILEKKGDKRNPPLQTYLDEKAN